MAPSRRTLCRAAGATTLVALAGCLDALRSGQVGVRIDNRDGRTHVVGVAFLDGDELVAERRFEVVAETEREYENVVAAGEYTVDVSLDGATHTTVPFSMNGCTDNTLFVAVDANETVEAGVLDEC
jgi:hypothetical protein